MLSSAVLVGLGEMKQLMNADIYIMNSLKSEPHQIIEEDMDGTGSMHWENLNGY
jgi:hypothetical protein